MGGILDGELRDLVWTPVLTSMGLKTVQWWVLLYLIFKP